MTRFLATVSALAVVAIASQASAADLPARSPAPVYSKAPEYVPVTNWSGWYIGGNVGGGWANGNTTATFTGNLPAPVSNSNNGSGGIGGAQVGYNFQAGSILAGFEADIQGASIKGSSSSALSNFNADGVFPTAFSASSKLSWFGTLRGRLGVTVTPSLLLYGTGGLAYGEVQNSANIQVTDLPFNDSWPASVSRTRTGWTVGAGAEWMFAPGWSAKAEYLHLDFGSASATAVDVVIAGAPLSQVGTYSWHNNFDIVRVGVNYHFH